MDTGEHKSTDLRCLIPNQRQGNERFQQDSIDSSHVKSVSIRGSSNCI